MEEELKQIRAGGIPLAIVVTDCDEGSMVRFENRNGITKRTHRCGVEDDYPRPVEFSAEVIFGFRRHPSSQFYLLGPAPVPGGNDPSGAPAAMMVAA